MQTSQKHIYAAGDVTGIMPLETVAAKQGSIAVRNMFEADKAEKFSLDYNLVPKAVFTSPEAATVGISEEDSIKKFGKCLCTTITMDHVEKAKVVKDVKGAVKMVLDPRTRKIIGVHIVSSRASEIITSAAYAIRARMAPEDIIDTVHVFPTYSEMLKKAAHSFTQDLGTMACCVD